MKVLFLTKYTNLGASSRMRTYQYLRFYREAGIECTAEAFFDDTYLKRLYSGQRSTWRLLGFYLKRLMVLSTAFKYDKIFIEKELFPYFPPFFEYLLFLFGKKYIVDYDDAIFHNYDRNSSFIIRNFLKHKIDTVMKHADVVIAGNSYLARRASEAGAQKIEIIPTVVDLDRYPAPQYETEGKFVVGWIGTKSTFEKHLLSIKDWLLKAQDLYDIEIHIIGITASEVFLGDHVKLVPWAEETEAEALSKIDVGIMPLRNSPWEEGKCAYKIVQYMACGKPVIASDVGINSELCVAGKTGFLADSEGDFLRALKTMIGDEKLRKDMGRRGRALVEEKFNLAVTSAHLTNIIHRR